MAQAAALTHLLANSGQGRTYHAIARHYGWALGQLFDEHHHKKVIILEDDMEIAPDFFDYFAAAGGLLYEDPTLLCVSAWNDNGQRVSRCSDFVQRRCLSAPRSRAIVHDDFAGLKVALKLGAVACRVRFSTLKSSIAQTSSQASAG